MVRQLFSSSFSLDSSSFFGGAFGSLIVASLLSAGCAEPRKAPAADEEAAESKPAASAKPSGAKTAAPAATSGISEKPNAKDARKLTEALPPPDRVQKIVNPKKREPYKGKTGGVRGVVFATGDASPSRDDVVAKMDSNCTTSRETFGSLFREGKNRELADALVAVTGYDGFVPASGTEVVLKAEGCAWEQRTVALTFGQGLAIEGVDNRPYVPEFVEQPMPAQLFVLPTAPKVHLPPQRPGRFTLVDSMRLFNEAAVFALPYPTADVSDRKGEFEITGIPVGEVTVNVMLPQTNVVREKKVTIEAGEIVDLKFEIPFSQTDYDKLKKKVPFDQRPAPGKGTP